MRCQSPSSSHLRYPPKPVCHGPNSSSGNSRHDEPVLSTHSIPPSTLRWSRLGRPLGGFCAGISGFTSSQATSVRSSILGSGTMLLTSIATWRDTEKRRERFLDGRLGAPYGSDGLPPDVLCATATIPAETRALPRVRPTLGSSAALPGRSTG